APARWRRSASFPGGLLASDAEREPAAQEPEHDESDQQPGQRDHPRVGLDEPPDLAQRALDPRRWLDGERDLRRRSGADLRTAAAAIDPRPDQGEVLAGLGTGRDLDPGADGLRLAAVEAHRGWAEREPFG